MRHPRHPVYVISKGRADCCLTADFLTSDQTPFRLVVEPQEAPEYASRYGSARVLVLPFANLGLGSIPARNWVMEHSISEGHARHWILDDNIRQLLYRHRGVRIACDSNIALAAVEDFTARYENIAVAGLQYEMFVPNGTVISPYLVNHHVYSCLLIDNTIPYRWRGRYNEDTDLCLQVIAGGLCTVLVNVFLASKVGTMTMKGGNSAELYRGDGRLKMARSLERMWPGVVETRRRFNRPQHYVDWKKLRGTLKLKPGVDLSKLPATDSYGLELVALKEVRAESLKKLLRDQSPTPE